MMHRVRWHNPVLALGNFDGLHRGHMKIIDRVRRRAGERGGTPAAMTFDPASAAQFFVPTRRRRC